ncbi:hypothetical protein HDU67_004121 [Dinochytrium kinnereticum]|nr:hypothetical protein HDU67_004121 [Dinochytrium kinnereticum]
MSEKGSEAETSSPKDIPTKDTLSQDTGDSLDLSVGTTKPARVSKAVPVYFFGSHDYGWIGPDNFKPFDKYREEYSKKNKSSSFLRALKEVVDPPTHQDILSTHKTDAENNGTTANKKRLRHEEGTVTRPKKKAQKTSSGEEANPVESAGTNPTKESQENVVETLEQRTDKLFKLRKKLQKFLQDGFPTSIHDKADKYLSEVENFPSITVELLMHTKIGKIIKKISLLEFADDVYNIKARSRDIMEKWRSSLPLDEADKEICAEDEKKMSE